MMQQIETHIEISATAEHVWSLLTDLVSYPQWNPFIRSIEGQIQAGQRLNVSIQPPESGGMRFNPTVLTVEPNRELRWRGKLFLPGLFDGEHYFRIDDTLRGVVFRQGEIFSGILVPLFRGSLDGAIKQGFIAMNVALKQRAETKND